MQPFAGFYVGVTFAQRKRLVGNAPLFDELPLQLPNCLRSPE